jgi:hypothetical protein
MSGGDFLFIFSFLILPTIILVSCIWLYILLRKGVLLPPARQMLVEDAARPEREDENVIPNAAESAVAPAPVIAMHVDHGDDVAEADAADDVALVGQQTTQFETLPAAVTESADQAADADTVAEDSTDDVIIAATAADADIDTGTEALPVQRDESEAVPAVVSESANADDAATATADIAPELADLMTVESSAASLPETGTVSVPEPEPEPIAALGDDVFTPGAPVADAATEQADAVEFPIDEDVSTPPPPEPDTADAAAGDHDLIQITDEHPFVEIASSNGVAEDSPAEPASNGVAQKHVNPRSTPASGRRKPARRPVAQLRPTEGTPSRTRVKSGLFRKGRGE